MRFAAEHPDWREFVRMASRSTDMPPKGVRTGKPFQQLLEFQADSIADFLRDTRSILKSKNPNIAFYMNGGARGANWAMGRLNRVLVKEQDLLGSEGGFLGGDLTCACGSIWCKRRPATTFQSV